MDLQTGSLRNICVTRRTHVGFPCLLDPYSEPRSTSLNCCWRQMGTLGAGNTKRSQRYRYLDGGGIDNATDSHLHLQVLDSQCTSALDTDSLCEVKFAFIPRVKKGSVRRISRPQCR